MLLLEGPRNSYGKCVVMNSANQEKTGSNKTQLRQQGPGHGHCARNSDGKIVSVTGDKLVMSNHEGKECCHTVAKDAKLTRDGTECNRADLKVGSKARVTTKKDDHNIATGIEAPTSMPKSPITPADNATAPQKLLAAKAGHLTPKRCPAGGSGA